MKARVKATNKTIDVINVMDINGNSVWEEINAISTFPTQYRVNELEFIDLPEDLQSTLTEPDYWEKLKHQAAITAMQGLLSNSLYLQHLIVTSIEDVSLADDVTMCAYDYATTLINKLKEESKCEK